ncbi:hypothetical protein BS78_09G057600 [Paspalum vaginatum]|nr:hypothetical protein BS78_09G057600 [Paspalum vaginatum]
MAPEFIMRCIISKKFDVFSLGVIIIKIMDGNEGNCDLREMPPEQFVEHVTEKWKARLQGTLGYSSEEVILQVETCIRIALRCVEFDRTRRPHVTDIINELKILEPEMIKKMSLASDQSDDDLTGQAVYRRWKHRWNKSATDAHPGYKQVAACLDLARRCTQKYPADRPNIWDIVSDLKKNGQQ